MAGNKIITKSKGKEDKNKGNVKPLGPMSEDSEDPDFALLRKPIHTSITGFGQARKIFDLATEELKDLLSNECDLLYECKVCRNIFRSLANFISHKRVYCKDKFNSSIHGHFIKATSTLSELMKIKRLEHEYQDALKDENQNKGTDEVDERIPLTKDLTTILDKMSKNKGVYESTSDEPQIELQEMPNSSVAVFQNIELSEEKKSDSMRNQIKELNNILSKDVAVLQSDGSFKIKGSVPSESGNVIQISDDEEHDSVDNPKCKICNMQFSTQKTLKFHMKYKHLESRLVYSCPDCLEIFSTSWSVYRHLFKVHRKTAAQIRRLRESIQAKAFRMNNPPASYEKRKNNMKPAPVQKITEEERLDQENQAWIDNMEGDSELPRCGGCGRTFERRAALAAHTHTCQPRCRALARRPQETKKIEIQIRKDYNKGPSASLNLPLKTTDSNGNKFVKGEPPSVTVKPINSDEKPEDIDKQEDEASMDVSEDDQKSNDTDSPEKPTEPVKPIQINKPIIRLPFAYQAEKSNLAAFRHKIQPDIDIMKLLCKKCDVQYNLVQELYDHMAEHLKWIRYACKLCNFKHYSFEKLPEHVKVVHKLKGDKDFYFSTVKAVDGTEAIVLSECADESNDIADTSPDSRRPSRCSSDSSRLSDDSSSSSTLVEAGSRKRKLYQSKHTTKRRKDFTCKVGDDNKDSEKPNKGTLTLGENDSSCSIKTFEENSSDVDDIEEKLAKKTVFIDTSSVASRRPVRRKAKPKNEDFEYDLSNLLKMEAQGYRDSQSSTNSKSIPNKRKIQDTLSNYDTFNKDCCGALIALSKRAVETSAALMKTCFSTYSAPKEIRQQNIFVRPLLPKSLSKSDKISPKKDNIEDKKECNSLNKDATSKISTEEKLKKSGLLMRKSEELMKKAVGTIIKSQEPVIKAEEPTIQNEDVIMKTELPGNNSDINKTKELTMTEVDQIYKIIETGKKDENLINKAEELSNNNEDLRTSMEKPTDLLLSKTPSCSNSTSGLIKTKLNIPSVVPTIFRRQSLEVIKNPIINKNISDFTKAGMKTKILVIKPINRNKDGTKSNTPIKFQTIKLKDPKNCSTNSDKSSDQVVVVKVPKVECAVARPTSDTSDPSIEKTIVGEPQINSSDKTTNHKSNEETIVNSQKCKIDAPSPAESDCNEGNSKIETKCNGNVETLTEVINKDRESIVASAEIITQDV